MESKDSTTFLSWLKHQNEINEFMVTDDVYLDDQKAIRLGLKLIHNNKSISKCEFLNFTFDNVPFETLIFTDCKFKTIKFNITNPVTQLTFHNCEIQNLEIIGQSDVYITDLSVEGLKTNISQFHIEGNIGSIRLSDAKLGNVGLINSLKESSLKVIDVASQKHLKLEGKYSKITIERSSLTCDANSVISDTMDFFHCSDLNVYFLGSNIKYTDFVNCRNCDIELVDTEAEYVTLNEGSYGLVKIEGLCDFKLKTSKNTENRSETTIDKFFLRNCELSEESNLYLNKVAFNEIGISGTENYGQIQIRQSSISNRLSLSTSNIRDTKFSNLTIEQSCIVDIHESDLSEVDFNNFRWNNNYKLNEKYNNEKFESETIYLRSLRESYRQLKALFVRAGNKIEALEFQKHELRIQLEVLRKGLEWNVAKIDNLNTLGNYLILYTHYKSSNFSQNIWKPFSLLFIFHLIFFNIFLFANPDLGVTIDLFNPSYEAFEKSNELYFTTIFPTHAFELNELNGSKVSIAGFWDFILRVSSSYFIFYFISASRKYHP